ncbi:TPA: hypothetical protein DIS56_02140 [Candidatus Saccharibacteria bacterium]|nr:MAG: hypothetical protein UX30_C0002G0058 [Candidatus Saccharibacteria bacterium GW2011_GWA2_46_10]OGL35769.1 MAG: hypothetical protein A3F05_01890 [Candidatus Saccharibacteria bacterium RIFCSPHIGHO2_12_FULL_47_17]HCM51911.1 hypothetical protein [Candidatus Saccharibacteria bacterium]
MKKNIKINLGSLKSQLDKLKPFFSKHGSFMAILFVLLIYLFIVWRISALAAAEPEIEAIDAALTSSAVPKIDSKAIEQIQQLEQNSPQVQALFNQARNNPFQE